MSPATLLAAWREGENESKVLESTIVSLLLENGVSRYIFPDATFYRSDISAHARIRGILFRTDYDCCACNDPGVVFDQTDVHVHALC